MLAGSVAVSVEDKVEGAPTPPPACLPPARHDPLHPHPGTPAHCNPAHTRPLTTVHAVEPAGQDAAVQVVRAVRGRREGAPARRGPPPRRAAGPEVPVQLRRGAPSRASRGRGEVDEGAAAELQGRVPAVCGPVLLRVRRRERQRARVPRGHPPLRRDPRCAPSPPLLSPRPLTPRADSFFDNVCELDLVFNFYKVGVSFPHACSC
jgi:hypothetical protein